MGGQDNKKKKKCFSAQKKKARKKDLDSSLKQEVDQIGNDVTKI